MAGAYDLGFRSLDETEEHDDRRLSVEGSVPSWLSGALIRNGPANFEFGGERATHWFDGLAMLRRYGFDDGTVRYSNRFLRTDAYAGAAGGETAGEFATDGGGTLRQAARWLRAAGPPESTDNANVHVARLGDHYVALTEAPRRVAFDPDSLRTRGEFRWTGDVPEHMATAHLAVAPGGETVGYATTFGRTPQYHLYRVPPDGAERERFAAVDAEGPAYVHDCVATERYAVLVEPPLRISVLRALAPWGDGILDALSYDADGRTRFLVVDRETGALVAEPTVSGFFVFHLVNAFEDGDDLVVDLTAFEDADIVGALSLETLSEDAFDAVPPGRLDRFRLDLDLDRDGGVERSRRYDGGLELPTVPRAVRGRPYRYAYAQATDRRGANGLAKIDVEAGTAVEWWERGVYVEEPRMVRRPDADREDDGVVLATALDADAGRSMLLIFDAETLTERARAPLPHALPFGFHGRYFPELKGAA